MNPITEDIAHLVDQVQIAHRLCVGFYQRLLPSIQEVATALECSFCSWNPAETNRPAGQYVAPQDKWAWDLVPMFATQHVYERVAGDFASQGDLSLTFTIYLDENFKKSQRKKLGIKGQPDPINLPKGGATVEVCIHRCTEDSKASFDSLWDAARWPDSDKAGWQDVGEKVEARLTRWSLAFFIVHKEQVIAELKEALQGKTESTT